MRSYYHVFYQYQPYISHQTPQKLLILVLSQWYSNCYMGPELANKYIWWQVRSMPVSLTNIFMCNLSIILNMILSICKFSCTIFFPVFSLINDSMFTILLRQMFWNYLARLISFFGVQEFIIICYQIFLSCKLNIRNSFLYIALANFIKTINHLFFMSRFTYTPINHDWVTLG